MSHSQNVLYSGKKRGRKPKSVTEKSNTSNHTKSVLSLEDSGALTKWGGGTGSSIKYLRVKPTSGIRLFEMDYMRLNGNYYKQSKAYKNADLEYKQHCNVPLRRKYEALANEINKKGIDALGELDDKVQIEVLKKKFDIPPIYIDQNLI